MLELLHIENIAIIERADIEFGARLQCADGRDRRGKVHRDRRTRRGAGPAHLARAHPHGRGKGLCQRGVQRRTAGTAGPCGKRSCAGGGRNAPFAARAVRRRKKRLPRERTAGDGRTAQTHRREPAQHPRPARRAAVARRRAAPCLPRPLWQDRCGAGHLP